MILVPGTLCSEMMVMGKHPECPTGTIHIPRQVSEATGFQTNPQNAQGRQDRAFSERETDAKGGHARVPWPHRSQRQAKNSEPGSLI
jgi:hypothetical protein